MVKIKDKRKQMHSKGDDRTGDFKNYEANWRISAVIHDGNWYDLKKWAKVAGVKKEEILSWVKANEDILVRHDDESDDPSYRVGHDEIVRWYEEEGFCTEDKIVPKNFPPKLWGGMTESEAFLTAPRRRTGVITITIDDDDIMARVRACTKGVATMYPDKRNRFKLYSLSALVIKKTLIQNFTSQEVEDMGMKSRTVLQLRELIDFDEQWLNGAFTFYLQYANAVIPNVAKETMEIYLPDEDERESQVITWVVEAMKKFDETKGVPFSGYLDAVLSRWPYNLPVDVLGKELSDFQRLRSRVVREIRDEGNESEVIDYKEIADRLGMAYDKYIELHKENETWLKVRNAAELTWEDSPNERAGRPVGEQRTAAVDHDVLSAITRATLAATLVTRDFDSGFTILQKISEDDFNDSFSSELSEEFLSAFSEELKELI